MCDNNEPYISVQSVEKLVDELEENMEISKSLNTSSDIDDEPLSALKNRLKDKIKVEPIIPLRRSTRRCVVDNNNFNQQLADIKFKSKQRQMHLKTEMAKHKDNGDLLMLGTSPKQEKAQTKKSTNNNATKKKRINSVNLTEQNEATAKRMRTQTKLTIEKGDHKIDKNEKQQVPGKSNLDKLKSKPPRIRRAKSVECIANQFFLLPQIMAPTAHMPPSANNTSSTEEAVTLEVVEAEDLSSLMIVTEKDSEKKEPVNVDKNADQENVDFNQLEAATNSLATNFNLLEQNTMLDDELNLTQESIEILQNNIHSMEISRTMLQNDLYLSSETGSENASIEHDPNLTNLADNIALVEQDNLKTTIQQNKNNDKTPLEQDALLQDELNFEIDSDDVLLLSSSWDGGMDDNDERNSIVNEMDRNESDIAASIVDSMSPLTALTTAAVSPEATAHPATNAVETNISLNDLRSFRIPKKTNNPKLQLETLQEPHNQALVNGEQQQRESEEARQQPANNIEHKQQHRVVNGRQQQKESLVNDNRQLPRCNAQKEPFFNGNPHQPTIANLQRQKPLKPETQICRPIRASVPDAVPIFVPPYQRSEQPAASSSVSSTFTIYRGMGRNSAAFDIKCWKYLDGSCANPNCNHQLSEIGDVRRRLNSMTNKQLIDCYNFILRHRLLFQKYFALFATIFGSRQMRNYMLRMINDCCLYMELCAPFIVDIYETLLRFHMSSQVTVAHLMKYLWKPNELLQYPLLINELLKILAIEYWHNYMPQLEELFNTRAFPIPLEFGSRIAELAVTQKNEMLKNNVCQLVLFTPIEGSYSTVTTVAQILYNDCADQPNAQLQLLLLAILRFQSSHHQ
ncbi:protein deadlock-like [Drosophila albomicans]|uniref:Protein deadlock-like n=1 Tax=Drosophila albomicans TaxID=7291 RepID=A0A6P8XYA7_DROAB|nr:protein deadlock-like [Drosophila albomicans]